MSKLIPNLVLAIMCKNEEKRICVTFDSVKEYINKFFIFDTGSTDNTVSVITDYCNKNNITLFLKQGTFVDFSKSRNDMLDYVDENLSTTHYVLLMDTNDEMRNMDVLSNFINSFKGNQSGFYLRQKWWSGLSLDTYLNIRLIKSHAGWRYKGVVHEYLVCKDVSDNKKTDADVTLRVEDVEVYQDRTLDDDKSLKRFFRDKELLYNWVQNDPTASREMFYLAQTCSCLGQNQESYNYYLKRAKLGGFGEEVYQAYYRLGDMSHNLGHDWEESLMWYLRAFQHSQRVEPLVAIVSYYLKKNFLNQDNPEWHTAYMYSSMACKLIWPQNQILFINKKHYIYTRWHQLAKICKVVNRIDEGKKACIFALKAENNQEDRETLKFYLEKELELMHELPINTNYLIATSLGNRELRLQQEFENKFDISDTCKTLVEQVITERKAQNKIVNIDYANEFVKNNIDISNNTIAIQQLLSNQSSNQASNQLNTQQENNQQNNQLTRKDIIKNRLKNKLKSKK